MRETADRLRYRQPTWHGHSVRDSTDEENRSPERGLFRKFKLRLDLRVYLVFMLICHSCCPTLALADSSVPFIELVTPIEPVRGSVRAVGPKQAAFSFHGREAKSRSRYGDCPMSVASMSLAILGANRPGSKEIGQ